MCIDSKCFWCRWLELQVGARNVFQNALNVSETSAKKPLFIKRMHGNGAYYGPGLQKYHFFKEMHYIRNSIFYFKNK